MKFNYKIQKRYVLIPIIIGIVLLISYLNSIPDNNMHIIFCDVGNADSIIIKTPKGNNILIDAGLNNGKSLSCLGKYLPFYKMNLELVIITHPEIDHFGGLVQVLDRYKVKQIIKTTVNSASPEYKKLLDKINYKNIQLSDVSAGNEFNFDDINFKILWPSIKLLKQIESENTVTIKSDGISVNDFSLVFLLNYRSYFALFTADADIELQSEYSNRLLAYNHLNLLKIPHHGAKNSISDNLLKITKPELAVISSGKNNKYDHPSSVTIELLNKYKINNKVTGIDGDIEIIVFENSSWKLN